MDGNYWRQLGAVNDVQENKPDSRPIYRFGRTEEEDWLKATKARIKEEKKSEFTKPLENKVEEIEDLTTLSVGIRNN